MSRHSQKSQARYGTPIRTAVMANVFAALLSESKRLKRSVGHVAGQVLAIWYAEDYLWAVEQRTKKKPPS